MPELYPDIEPVTEWPERDSAVLPVENGKVELWLGDDGIQMPALDAYLLGAEMISAALTALGGPEQLNIELLARDLEPILDMTMRKERMK